MSLTREEFDEACKEICPHCRAGKPLKKRGTGEWQHTMADKGSITVSVCWAGGLRNGKFAVPANG